MERPGKTEEEKVGSSKIVNRRGEHTSLLLRGERTQA